MIENLLKKQMVDSTNIINNIKDQISVLSKKIDEEMLVLGEAQHILQGMCKHLNTHKVPTEYPPPVYDTTLEYYTIECLNCNKVLDSKCIRSNYGQGYN